MLFVCFRTSSLPLSPQHTVNGALADSDFLMEVRRQHQHLLVAHVFEGVAVALKPRINICLILSVKFQR